MGKANSLSYWSRLMKKESLVWVRWPPSNHSAPLRKKASGPLELERISKLKGTSTPGRISKTPRQEPRAEKGAPCDAEPCDGEPCAEPCDAEPCDAEPWAEPDAAGITG